MAKIKKKEGILKLQKLGYTAEEIAKIQTALGDDESEIEDIDLLTEAEAETLLSPKFKDKFTLDGRVGVLDGFDKTLKRYEALLSPEQKTVYDGKKTEGKVQYMLDCLQNKVGGADHAKAFQDRITLLEEEREKDYVRKTDYEEIQRKLTPAQKRAVYAEIVEAATRDGRISQTMKEDRRFRNNLIADYEESMQKKGYSIDYETGEFRDKEGKPVVNNKQILTATNFIDTVITEFPDWAKKSEGGGGSATVVIEGGKDTSKLTASQLKNLEQMGV